VIPGVFRSLSKLGKAVLTILQGVANSPTFHTSGVAQGAHWRLWRVVEKKAARGLERLRRISILSTAMAVLAVILFVSIVLGYI
jgi:hypothetical protein